MSLTSALQGHVPELNRIYPDQTQPGWKPMLRRKAGYIKPSEWYQSVVESLVTETTTWVDVGGGHQVFPSNPSLAMKLSQRCKLLVGIDPSENLVRNEFVHQRIQASLEDATLTETFDLATFHMVAEHIEEPAKVCAALSNIVKPGGHVVILTPYKWSLASTVAAIIPNRFHAIAIRSSSTSRVESDVFPTRYRLNTRRDLQKHLSNAGFDEVFFQHVADLSLFQRFRYVLALQLAIWRCCRVLGIRYPESNLLVVYRRRPVACK